MQLERRSLHAAGDAEASVDFEASVRDEDEVEGRGVAVGGQRVLTFTLSSKKA